MSFGVYGLALRASLVEGTKYTLRAVSNLPSKCSDLSLLLSLLPILN